MEVNEAQDGPRGTEVPLNMEVQNALGEHLNAPSPEHSVQADGVDEKAAGRRRDIKRAQLNAELARLEADTAMVKQDTAQLQKISTLLQQSIEAYKRAMCDHLDSLLESFAMQTALDEGPVSVATMLAFIFAKLHLVLAPDLQQSSILDDPAMFSQLPSAVVLFQPSEVKSWERVEGLELEGYSQEAKKHYQTIIAGCRKWYDGLSEYM